MANTSMQHNKGFTVVELLVVVAVIGVLATITIFAFGSWRARTATTEVKHALTSLSSSLKNELTFNSVYPASVPTTYDASSTVTINYKSTASTYCASGTSTSVSGVVWYISNTSPTPTKTACS